MSRLIILFFLAVPLWANQELVEEEDFSFNPLKVKRDPFAPPPVEASESVSKIQSYDLFDIKLVGLMKGLGAPKAMLVLPDGKTHVVQRGDPIGRNQGYVVSIEDDQLVVQETFRDHRNREKKESRVLRIER